MAECQDRVLKALAGRTGSFYLAGGTALARCYFQHRESDDLDFFATDFSRRAVVRIVRELADALGKKIELANEETRRDRARFLIYAVHFTTALSLKLDFVEDLIVPLKQVKVIDGIPVLRLEDIYLRKVYAITGHGQVTDLTGRKRSAGGRQEPKDLLDLYCLSNTFMRLSDFAGRHCGAQQRENLVRWFNTYDRMEMKTGLLELRTTGKTDYRAIESHFKEEIDAILDGEM